MASRRVDPPRASGVAPEDEPLLAVRRRAARYLWLFLATVGTPVIIFLLAKGLSRPGPKLGYWLGAALFAAVLTLLWFARRTADPRIMGPVLLLLAGLPGSSILLFGPSSSGLAGLVAVAAFATVFLGRRSGVLAAGYAVALFAAVLVLQADGDQVGISGYWIAPRWLVMNGFVAGLGWLGMVVAGVGAVMTGLADAVERERTERDRRLASERALAAASRLEAIGRLSAGVVHDTRNALAVLRSGIAELERRPIDAEDREILDDMRSALEASQETMRQLLSLGAEPGGAAQDVELVERVERFARAVGRVLPSSITVRVEPRAAGQARVSPGLLDQALLNLTLNARDAMPRGGALRLGVERVDDGGRAALAIDVEDRGDGIPPEVASRLFEPFATSKPDGKGTGLGLAMVQGFATAAGGRVEVESHAGRGTRFRLLLPSSDATARADTASKPATP